MNAVRTSLQAVLAGRSTPPEYADPRVVEGCPESLVVWGTAVSKYDLEGRNVSVPSEHRLMVYLVRDGIYSKTFGDEPYVDDPVEYVCQLDDCAEVTIGLFVPESASPQALKEGLSEALYLTPATLDVDPTVDPTRCLATRTSGECDYLRPGVGD